MTKDKKYYEEMKNAYIRNKGMYIKFKNIINLIEIGWKLSSDNNVHFIIIKISK